MNILTFTQLEAQGAQTTASGQLIFQHKKFRLGPAFAKRCHKAAMNFCRIARAECLLIDYENYLGIWLHYHPKKAEENAAPSVPERNLNPVAPSLDQILAAPVKDVEIDQLFDNALQKESSPPDNGDDLSPEFIESVKETLVAVIGPMAPMLIQAELEKKQQVRPSDFIISLANSLPTDYYAQVFLSKFFP